MIYNIYVEQEVQAKITVQVQPNASRNMVTRFEDGVLYIKIAAPPVKGQANKVLLKFLSSITGIRKSNLTIEKGITGKRKVIIIDGVTQDNVTEQLQKYSTKE
jgi:uncharacterized protein (TIGR00251 family)